MIHLGQHSPSLACISIMDFHINVVLLSAYQYILQMDLDTLWSGNTLSNLPVLEPSSSAPKLDSATKT